MTGEDVYDLLLAIQEATEDLVPGDIILDHDETVKTSKTTYDPNGKITIRIGTKDFLNNTDELRDEIAIEPVVKLLHEICGHVGQEIYEFQKDTPLTRILGLNCIACRSSDYYYYGRSYADEVAQEPKKAPHYTKEYASQPIELAAQYMAFKAAQNYLSVAYSPEKAEKMLMGYAKESMLKNIGFIRWSDVLHERDTRLQAKNAAISTKHAGIDDPVRSKDPPILDDVLHAFDKRFEKCIFSKREHRIFADEEAPMAIACRSNRLSAVQTSIFENCQTGIHQDFMVCTATYRILKDSLDEANARRHKFRILHGFHTDYDDETTKPKPFDNPVFRTFCWDYDEAFTFTMPDDLLTSSRWKLSQLHNMMKNIPDEKKKAHPSGTKASKANDFDFSL